MIINYFKYPVVKQSQITDCGPACLLSILKFYGGKTYLDRVRIMCHTDHKGSRLYDLKTAAELLGFQAAAYRFDKDQYPRHNEPAVLHFLTHENLDHFVVLYKIKKDKYLIGDPAKGLFWLNRNDLDRHWQSRVLLQMKRINPFKDPFYCSDWLWLIHHIKKYWDYILQILFCSLITIFSGFFTAFLIKNLTEVVIPNQNKRLLIISLIFLSSFLLFKSLFGYVRNFLFYKHGKILFENIFNDSMTHFIHLPFNIISRFSTGDMTSRFLDLFRIQSFYQFTLLTGLADLFVLTGSLCLMMVFSPLLSFVSALFVLSLSGIFVFIYPNLRKLQNSMLRKGAGFSQGLIETMEGMNEISAFCANDYFMKLNAEKFNDYLKHWKKTGLFQTHFVLSTDICLTLFTVLFIFLGVYQIISQKLTFGNWLAAYILSANLIQPVFRLLENALKASESREAVNRLRDLLVHPVENETNVEFNKSNDWMLTLNNCTFQWPKYSPLFEKLNISIPKGQITVITGDNGCGKSTLIHAILRQFRFSEGDILWNNLSVVHTGISAYRRCFGVVTQDVKIFNLTLRENIFLGRKMENYQWLQVIQRDFQWFFQKFDMGIMTILGDGTRNLSGGEKQIVGLLRAVLNEPEILLLDECFNSLDQMTKNWVLLWLKSYAQDHAVLLISHDPGVCREGEFVINMNTMTAG
jgi:ATP-binding cassette subfamily B protein